MVDVHTHVRTQRDPLHAAVEVGLNLPAMDWTVMVRKGRREGGWHSWTEPPQHIYTSISDH